MRHTDEAMGLMWPATPLWVKQAEKEKNGRKGWLDLMPTSLHATTCRCTGGQFVGWYYNHDRQMWVCGTCNKPSAAHQGYNLICMWCEEYFTIQMFPVSQHEDIETINEAFKTLWKQPTCRDCGGDNDARILEESLF